MTFDPAHLVVEGSPCEHQGDVVFPLALVLPLAVLLIPKMQAAGEPYQPVRELPPYLPSTYKYSGLLL